MFQIPCHHSWLLGTIPDFFRHFCICWQAMSSSKKAIKPLLTWCHCLLTCNDNMYLKELDEWQPVSNVCNSWPLSHRSLFDVRLWCWKCHRWYPDSLTPPLIHGEEDTMINGTNNHECYIQNIRMKLTLTWHYFSWYNCQQGISSPPSLQCGHWLQGDMSLSLAPRIEVKLCLLFTLPTQWWESVIDTIIARSVQ